VEAIGDLIKDRIGNAVWITLGALEEANAEELRPLLRNGGAVEVFVVSFVFG
jgi:hypothetical protein